MHHMKAQTVQKTNNIVFGGRVGKILKKSREMSMKLRGEMYSYREAVLGHVDR